MIAFLRENRTPLGLAATPLGVVAEANYAHGEWAKLPPARQVELANFLHFDRSRPDFIDPFHDILQFHLDENQQILCRGAEPFPAEFDLPGGLFTGYV